ncbi:MAG TPA: alpha/beta family hydrolase [Candidatus Limnocylindria bacterium]|nr:alpha/beta family hydrolase [Candidatus Limnocylindria bacterium]
MREEPRRIDGRLEATLRIPDVEPRAVAVVLHPLPTHGGTMRNPLIAAIARACAERGMLALRVNFRGTEESAGEFTGGEREHEDVAAAVDHARSLGATLPAAVAGFSFGALMTLKWMAGGGRPDAYALAGVPLRSASLAPQDLPPVPDGAFIVQAERDQFGTAAEVRARYPRARVREIAGVDHFFIGKFREVGDLIAASLAHDLRID